MDKNSDKIPLSAVSVKEEDSEEEYDDVDGPQFSRLCKHGLSNDCLDHTDSPQFSRLKDTKKKQDKLAEIRNGNLVRVKKNYERHQRNRSDELHGIVFRLKEIKENEHSPEAPELARVETCPSNDLNDTVQRRHMRPTGLDRQKSYSNSDLDKFTHVKYIARKEKLREVNSYSHSTLYKDNSIRSLDQKRHSYSGYNLEKKERAQFVRHKYKDKYSSGDESDGGQFERRTSSKVPSVASTKEIGISPSTSLKDTKDLTRLTVENNGDIRHSTGCIIKENGNRVRNASGTPMRDFRNGENVNESEMARNSSPSSSRDLTTYDNESIPEFYIPEEELTNSEYLNTTNPNLENTSDSQETLESQPMINEHDESYDLREGGCWNSRPRRYITKTIPALFSAVLFLLDVGTDIQLAVTYRNAGDKGKFGVTIGCVIAPAFIMMLMDLSWIYLDQTSEDINHQRKKKVWVPHVILTILTVSICGRLFRTGQYWWYFMKAIRSDDRRIEDQYKEIAKNLRRDCLMLNFVEAFLESACQFAVQLFIMFAFHEQITILRVVTLSLSLVSIAWAYSAYYRSNREVSNPDNKEDICFFVLVVYFLAAGCCLVSRFVSGALFAAEFRSNFDWLIGVGLVGIAHILILFLYICLWLKPKLEGTAHNCVVKLLYYFFFAYVNFFLFMNLGGRGSPRMKNEMYIRYGAVYVENILLAVFLVVLKGNNPQVLPMLGVVLVSSILHVVLLNVFYKLLHPSTGRYKNYDPFSQCFDAVLDYWNRKENEEDGES